MLSISFQPVQKADGASKFAYPLILSPSPAAVLSKHFAHKNFWLTNQFPNFQDNSPCASAARLYPPLEDSSKTHCALSSQHLQNLIVGGIQKSFNTRCTNRAIKGEQFHGIATACKLGSQLNLASLQIILAGGFALARRTDWWHHVLLLHAATTWHNQAAASSLPSYRVLGKVFAIQRCNFPAHRAVGGTNVGMLKFAPLTPLTMFLLTLQIISL
jgi:hypothetical protein